MHRSLSLAFVTAVGVIALTSLQHTGSAPVRSRPSRARPTTATPACSAMPAVSADHIAFVYADDLWVADLDGKNARRLTSDIGVEIASRSSRPTARPSPSAPSTTATLDVYTIPVERRRADAADLAPRPGRRPRLHARRQGRAVLVAARTSSPTGTRNSSPCRSTGGMPTQLPIPYGVEASYSPDGSHIAYTPLGDRTAAVEALPRRHARPHLDLPTSRTTTSTQIPQPEGRCNDIDPNWVGSTVYFRSDRNGEYNLFAYDAGAQATSSSSRSSTDFPVVDIGDRRRQRRLRAGRLPAPLRPGESAGERGCKIGVAADLRRGPAALRQGGEVRPQRRRSRRRGARAVFEFRGEIVTVPAEKGDPRNLTNTAGVHERAPGLVAGRQVDRLLLRRGRRVRAARPRRRRQGRGEDVRARRGRLLRATRSGRRTRKKIAFVDNSQSLFWIDLDERQGDEDRLRAALRPVGAVAAAAGVVAGLEVDRLRPRQQGRVPHRLRLRRSTSGKSPPITDGLSDAVDPVFDAGGKYLYFLASTDAGPVNQWFAQSNADMRVAAVAVPRRAEEGRAVAARQGERRGEERGAEEEGQEGREEGREAEDKPVDGRHRLRRHRPARRRRCRCRPGELRQPAGRRGRAGLSTSRRPRRAADGGPPAARCTASTSPSARARPVATGRPRLHASRRTARRR